MGNAEDIARTVALADEKGAALEHTCRLWTVRVSGAALSTHLRMSFAIRFCGRLGRCRVDKQDLLNGELHEASWSLVPHRHGRR